jgi:hypothetical protein
MFRFRSSVLTSYGKTKKTKILSLVEFLKPGIAPKWGFTGAAGFKIPQSEKVNGGKTDLKVRKTEARDKRPISSSWAKTTATVSTYR